MFSGWDFLDSELNPIESTGTHGTFHRFTLLLDMLTKSKWPAVKLRYSTSRTMSQLRMPTSHS